MNKTFGIIIVVLVIVAAIFGIGVFKFKLAVNNTSIGVEIGGAASEKDATYRIDGKSVTLKNGVFEVAGGVDSASKTITRYFGNEVRHDFNDDGREDVAFLLTQETGGSGTFYYVVAALNTVNGYVGSSAVFLGDRVAPQSTSMSEGNVIVVNYADRAPNESFSVQPHFGKSKYILLDPKTMKLSEVAR